MSDDASAPAPPTTPRGALVAVAAQGGGSHAAYVAGVLERLLARGVLGDPADRTARTRLVGLSGSSGGAVAAGLVWSALADPRLSWAEAGGLAARRLAGFWEAMTAHSPLESAENFWRVQAARQPVQWELSSRVFAGLAARELARDVETALGVEGDGTMPAPQRPLPALFIGATDVETGARTVFRSPAVGVPEIVASASVPPLFRAAEITAMDGHTGLYWDGLFSCNPPIREFTDLEGPLMQLGLRTAIPDEIWVIQVNPQARKGEPVSANDIADRRNELAGNLALNQEVEAIEMINAMIRRNGTFLRPLKSRHGRRLKPITVRRIALDPADPAFKGMLLDLPSKLDRSYPMIDALRLHGAERTDAFLRAVMPDLTAREKM